MRKELAVALAIVFAVSAQAQSIGAQVRDGQPCFKELCVGDDITQLLDLDWVAVDVSPRGDGKQAATDAELATMLRGKPDVVDSLAPYLKRGGSFDRDGLRLLGQLDAFCHMSEQTLGFGARYVDSSKRSVLVAFLPVWHAASGRVRFTVQYAIARLGPLDVPGFAAVESQANADYQGTDFTVYRKKWQSPDISKVDKAHAYLHVHPLFDDGAQLVIQASNNLFIRHERGLKQQPACMGARAR